MAEERKGRSAVELLFDTLKPRIERTVREYGGRVAFALPGIGDALIAALSAMGPAAFGEVMMAAGGVAHIPRSYFSEGQIGNALHDLTNEIIDELGQAIAHEGEEVTPDRAAGLIERIIGRRAGTTSAAGGGREMEQEGFVATKDRAGNIVPPVFHHQNCVELPPIMVTGKAKSGGKGGKPSMKPNPALRKMPRSHAKAQGIAEHAECMKIFDAAAPKDKEKSAGRKKPLEIIGELTDVERTELQTWLTGLGKTKRAYVMSEFEKRLTSVEELRALLTFPDALRYGAVELFKDMIQERVEKMKKWGGEQFTGARDEIRVGVQRAVTKMDDWATRLRARAVRRKP